MNASKEPGIIHMVQEASGKCGYGDLHILKRIQKINIVWHGHRQDYYRLLCVAQLEHRRNNNCDLSPEGFSH